MSETEQKKVESAEWADLDIQTIADHVGIQFIEPLKDFVQKCMKYEENSGPLRRIEPFLKLEKPSDYVRLVFEDGDNFLVDDRSVLFISGIRLAAVMVLLHRKKARLTATQ